MLPRQFAHAQAPAFPESPRGSDTTTEGVRVQAQPRYMPEHSDPDATPPTNLDPHDDDHNTHARTPRFVFSYRIRITNNAHTVVTLLDRHWIITDADAHTEEIRGPGVVGHRPRLRPGQSFEYESFCPIQTPWGTMEGTFRFQKDPAGAGPGELFDVAVQRFYLVAEDNNTPPPEPTFDDLAGL